MAHEEVYRQATANYHSNHQLIHAFCFPDELKYAIIRPHLKKTNTDADEPMNYRPVSNLHFINKVLEKLAVKRLEQHIIDHSIYDPLQSAYRVAHSTETAIIKIHNDIVNGIDKDQCTILASLDLSAAFDTIDHDIFIGRMHAYGIRETALKWFQSYLDRRSYRVLINNAFSPAHTLSCGVTQGSALGAIMYTIYEAPLANIINKHSINYHCYADDTQIYIQCANNTKVVQEAITRIQDWITDVSKWMSRNALKINEDMTEFIIFSSKHYTYDRMSIQIGTNTIQHNNKISKYLESDLPHT